MDVEMEASPRYFDPEDLTSREQFRRYGWESFFTLFAFLFYFIFWKRLVTGFGLGTASC